MSKTVKDASQAGDDKRKADNLSSATDEVQINTEVFEIDEEQMNALPPEEQVQVLRTKLDKAKQEFVATVQINETLTQHFEAMDAQSKIQASLDTAAKDEVDLTVSTKTFTHEGKKYGFALPFMTYRGKRIGADEILADKELQKTLVTGGFGIIKKA